MLPWKRVLENGAVTGAIATAATTAIVAWLGKRETGSAAAPLNATSHIAFGEEAAYHDETSVKYTLTGAAINAAAMVGWSAVQEELLGRWVRKGSPARALASGAAVSALAYVVDYHVVPKRLTPGFEKRLSKKAMFATYAAMALSLAAGARTKRR
jgi:Na+/proline symporter